MMKFSKSEADEILEKYGECWMKTSTYITYLAVVEDKGNSYLYNIEMGILKGIDMSLENITLEDIPKYCSIPNTEINNLNLQNNIKEEIVNNNNVVKPKIEFVEEIVPQTVADHKIRPLLGGCTIKSQKSDTKGGTLGAFLKLKGDDYKEDIFFISNNHVLSSSIEPSYDELIFQPNNKPNDYRNTIGLSRYGCYGDTYNEDGSPCNTLDVAFGVLLTKSNDELSYKKGFIWDSKEELQSKGSKLKGITCPENGMKVKIYGKSSREKNGYIKSINAMVSVVDSYKTLEKKIFKNQILISNISVPGDSGALLISSENKVVGLIHAGDSNNCSIANNINHIFDGTFKISGKKVQLDKFLT